MKKLLPLLLLSLFPLSLDGQCIIGDCKNGPGYRIYRNKSQYIGELEKKKFNGLGFQLDKNGFISSGVWRKGKIVQQESSQSVSDSLQLKYPEEKLPQFHILFSSSGTPYEGFITEGNKDEGKGSFTVQSGDRKGHRYEGQFLGEQFEGEGSLIMVARIIEGEELPAAKYSGGFKDGKYSGNGTFTSGTVQVYSGEWKDDQPDGQGTSTYENSGKYVGGHKDGKSHGQGTQTYPDGGKYVGGHKDGKFHGQGTSTAPDGSKYEGEFKDGQYHGYGQGIAYFPNGSKYEGEFKDGIPNGQGISNISDGSKYVGGFKDGKSHGQGTKTLANGSKYVGEWKDDMPNGQGTTSAPDGSKYVGGFKDGNYHGEGTQTLPDGSKYVGEFNESKTHGLGTINSPDGSKWVGEFNEGNFNIGMVYAVNGEISSGIFANWTLQTPWTIEAVSNYLKGKYPQFSGFDSETSSPVVTAVKSSGASISGFIAVLEFEGNNISSGEVRALTDRLRNELVGSSDITIIERGKMEEILQEQSFQQTGCVSSECAVEVGKLLGVEQIVTGNISKVGTFYSITARVVSIQTGEIVRSTIYDHSGDIGGLLTQGMKKVAEELGK